jgi:hypothetical protein
VGQFTEPIISPSKIREMKSVTRFAEAIAAILLALAVLIAVSKMK